MLLVIDNYDSFTYNLVQYLGEMNVAMQVQRNDQITVDQVRALKHAAFCLCLLNRYPACRAEFIRIYDIDPDFDLTPAEAGHPSWTKTFAGAKAQAKRAQADKAKKKAP